MKIQVSQDTLYQFIIDHNLKLVRLAELTGMSEASINVCFKHYKGTNGLPRKFTNHGIQKINEALPQIAEALQGCILKFGSAQTFTNSRGSTYDPSLIEPMKRIGEWMNITALVMRVLGWSQDKKEATLISPSAKIYGCISREDADRMNAELLSVAAVLSSYEVVLDAEQSDNNKGTRVEGSPSVGLDENAWSDTAVDLLARYAAFHRLFPDGLIAFSVCGGFTVCEDDARLLARADTTLKPYTDLATGHVTLHMNAANVPNAAGIASPFTALKTYWPWSITTSLTKIPRLHANTVSTTQKSRRTTKL